jgi:hypothetical protein
MSISIFATDELPTDTEIIVETENSETLPDKMTAEDAEGIVDTFLSKIENLSTWIYVTFSGLSIGAIALITKTGVNKILPSIFELFRKSENKIDDRFLQYEGKIMGEFNTKVDGLIESIGKVESGLKGETENLEKVLSILLVFIMNSNESASAKAEMMSLLQGLKKYDGEIIDIVKKAQETIDKVKEEKKALAAPTPDLDKLIEEETINLKL